MKPEQTTKIATEFVKLGVWLTILGVLLMCAVCVLPALWGG